MQSILIKIYLKKILYMHKVALNFKINYQFLKL